MTSEPQPKTLLCVDQVGPPDINRVTSRPSEKETESCYFYQESKLNF